LALNLQLLSYLRRICSQCFRHPQYLHVQYTNFELCVIYRSGETLLLSFDESLLSKPVNVATTMDTIQKEAKPQRSTWIKEDLALAYSVYVRWEFMETGKTFSRLCVVVSDVR